MGPEAAYVFALMLKAAPPEKAWPAPGWGESIEARRSRYAAIAEDIAAVVWDPEVRPLFAGEEGRKKTAALVVAIGKYESGFDKDVDVGPCYRGGGLEARCDHGRSACILQIHTGTPEGTTAEGWTQADLFADRRKCIRAGLNAMHVSFAACPGEATRLNVYASGTCEQGHAVTGSRMYLARRLYAEVARED